MNFLPKAIKIRKVTSLEKKLALALSKLLLFEVEFFSPKKLQIAAEAQHLVGPCSHWHEDMHRAPLSTSVLQNFSISLGQTLFLQKAHFELVILPNWVSFVHKCSRKLFQNNRAEKIAAELTIGHVKNSVSQ